MTKTDYKKLIRKLNKKLAEKLEVIRAQKNAQKEAMSSAKRMMETDPRKHVIDETAKKFRDEVRENDS